MSDPPSDAHFRQLAILIGIVLILAAPFLAWHWFNAEWVPTSITSQLTGASESEVLELLGEPDSVNSEPDRWAYRRTARLAEFRVDFGADKRVVGFSYDR